MTTVELVGAIIEAALRADERPDPKEVARAVLRELREPSDEMLFGFGVHKARMKGNWRAMVDAALAEDMR